MLLLVAIAVAIASAIAHLLLVRARAQSREADYQSPLTPWVDRTLYATMVLLGFWALPLTGVYVSRAVESEWPGYLLTAAGVIGLLSSPAWLQKPYDRLIAKIDQRKWK